MSTYVCHVCRGRDECLCDGPRIAEERDEALQRVRELEELTLTPEEARALNKILDEVDYVGFGEFARLDDEEEAAARSAQAKMKTVAATD